MKFTKMQGLGNDYIYVNCLEESIEDPAALAVRVSDRHFGVGSDGLVMICPSDVADYQMRMFNADGSEGVMCGNASRCIAKYVFERGMTTKNPVTLETLGGIKTLSMEVEGGVVKSVTVDMGAPVLQAEEIPTALKGESIVAQPLTDLGFEVTCLSMGNPHCVTFVADVEAIALEKIGPQVERHPWFPERVNAEFVKVIDAQTLQMRVWERGSGETLACGTGACAAVVASVLNGFCRQDQDITVQLRGGDLTIRWDSARNTVFKTGPAEFVCTGEYV